MTLLLITAATAGSLAPWQTSWNAAAAALNAGDAGSCLAGVPDDPAGSENPDAWLDLGYTCAVVASDLGRADRYRDLLGPHYQPRAALDIHHAWLKRQAGDSDAALALLAPQGWHEPHQQAVGRTLELTLLTDTGQWDRAYELAIDPAIEPVVEPKAQAALARRLTAVGRPEDARWVFDQACPRLDEPEAWGCASVLRLPSEPASEQGS
jgi:hypothetical protein